MREANVKLACRSANISRNTAYTHCRKDARFRRQWQHAADRGRDESYRRHLKQLETDPVYQRALQRLARQFGCDHGGGPITLNAIRQAAHRGSARPTSS
jgi:hypothetical protein